MALTGKTYDFLEVFFQILHFRQRHVLHFFRSLSLSLFDCLLNVNMDGYFLIDIHKVACQDLFDEFKVLVKLARLVCFIWILTLKFFSVL